MLIDSISYLYFFGDVWTNIQSIKVHSFLSYFEITCGVSWRLGSFMLTDLFLVFSLVKVLFLFQLKHSLCLLKSRTKLVCSIRYLFYYKLK